MIKRKSLRKAKPFAVLLLIFGSFCVFVLWQLRINNVSSVVTSNAINIKPSVTKIPIGSTTPKQIEPQKLSQSKNINKVRLTCDQLQSLLKKATSSAGSMLKNENDHGNRGVYISSLDVDKERPIDIVLKVATLPEMLTLDMHQYRYKTAVKEIQNIRRLEKLGWKGVPKLYGACIQPREIVYAVERVFGQPLCAGLGTNVSCGLAEDLTKAFDAISDPGFYALTFATKVACFFEQFERDHVFMEDMTGSNLFYSEKTFDIYVVDADSLIFYGNNPINSGSSCKRHKECPLLPGNFWGTSSLNQFVYSSCLETRGNCVDYICSGIDASLHACGVGRWLLSGIRNAVPKSCLIPFKEVVNCLTAPVPAKRCSFKMACEKLSAELSSYQDLIGGPIKID